jgi:shikimate kinase
MENKRMSKRRVALIGHSGAGKTACLLALHVDRLTADMDAGPGKAKCPSLNEALSWLANDGHISQVLVVSNHESMLKEMLNAKLHGQHSDQFQCFNLVYMHKPLEELRRDLLRLTAEGSPRPADGVQYTIDHYERLHTLYSTLADRTVECKDKSVEAVADEVWAIVSSGNGKNL